MSDKCPDCPAPSADMDGFIVSGPGGAPRSESAGVSSSEGPFAREAPQTGHFILKGKVSSSSPLPEVPEPGWAYEAAEAGTYGGVRVTPGDLIWCAGVNPVQWRIAQSDFDGAVRSVSVQQVLSSGTKIATVTVDGQATDLYCETGGGIQTLSGEFGCETHELSPAVDGPAVLYATRMVFIDQTGFEMLEGGNAPYGHYSSAYSGSHQSASFSTSVPSSAPYAVALSTGTDEYASSYNLKTLNLLDWSYGGAVKVSDLLAAGEAGVKLVSTGGGDPYGDGTLGVYASFSAGQDGSYTVSYSARKDAVTEDVLTARIDGKDGSGETVSSVDVSPLLNYIGGRIEEVPAGDVQMLPLADMYNPDAEPPLYFINPDIFAFFSSNSQIYPSAGEVSGGAQIISFPASSPEPDSFMPVVYYGDTSGMPTFVYAKVDSSTGQPAIFSIETALAGPLELDELTPTNPPVPTGNTVSLVTERVEGDAPAYSFTLYSGSVEMKKVLRIYPSCDNAIDLSGLAPAPAPASSDWEWNPEPAFQETLSSGFYYDDDDGTPYSIPSRIFAGSPEHAMIVISGGTVANEYVHYCIMRLAGGLNVNLYIRIPAGSPYTLTAEAVRRNGQYIVVGNGSRNRPFYVSGSAPDPAPSDVRLTAPSANSGVGGFEVYSSIPAGAVVYVYLPKGVSVGVG